MFALAFVKNVLDGKQLREVNQQFMDIAKERGFYSEGLMDEVAKTGSCQHLEQVPDDVKQLFKVANEVNVDAHVNMQAAFQAHTDLAVSKTINLANSATMEDVEYAYRHAFANGCKGITIYRDGSKSAQVLEVGQKAKTESPAGQVLDAPRERPAQMRGVTDRIRTGHGNTYITINFDEDNKPFEVFTTVGKAGSCDSANLEAITRLVSLALRSGIPTEQIVEQLQGITCHPVWDQGIQVRSTPDAVGIALKRHAISSGQGALDMQDMYGEQLGLPITSKPKTTGNGNSNGHDHTPTQACPECGGPVAFQEGCMTCQVCAWNQCGG